MSNLEQHVGKKVKGIKFASEKYDGVSFSGRMERYIGQEGVIEEYELSNNTFKISFKSPESDFWFYPVEEILPQLLELEIIGYLINNKKYTKIIASLCGISEAVLTGDVHFYVKSQIEEKVKEFDLLNKCTPVYKKIEIKLPIINGYEGEDEGEYLQYGCAKISKSWFTETENRFITSLELNSHIIINSKQIEAIKQYLNHKQ